MLGALSLTVQPTDPTEIRPSISVVGPQLHCGLELRRRILHLLLCHPDFRPQIMGVGCGPGVALQLDGSVQMFARTPELTSLCQNKREVHSSLRQIGVE